MPREDGLRLDDVHGRAPAVPRAREPRSQHPVGGRETGPGSAGSMHDRELLAEREDPQVQRRA